MGKRERERKRNQIFTKAKEKRNFGYKMLPCKTCGRVVEVSGECESVICENCYPNNYIIGESPEKLEKREERKKKKLLRALKREEKKKKSL